MPSTDETTQSPDLPHKGGIRKAQAARRRRLLLEAAFHLFSERGYREASVRELTRATGVTEAVLYHYFENKAGILRAVLTEYAPFAPASAMLDQLSNAPVDDALRQAGNAILALLYERRQLVLTLLAEAPAEPELATVLTGFLRGIVDDIADFLRFRQESGEFRSGVDTQGAAHAFAGALIVRFLSSALQVEVGSQSTDRETFVDGLVASLMCDVDPALT
jgi:AcrR family transcriptional regulator